MYTRCVDPTKGAARYLIYWLTGLSVYSRLLEAIFLTDEIVHNSVIDSEVLNVGSQQLAQDTFLSVRKILSKYKFNYISS